MDLGELAAFASIAVGIAVALVSAVFALVIRFSDRVNHRFERIEDNNARQDARLDSVILREAILPKDQPGE
ncbi:MAG: hypothetical protein OXQ29_13170 [Rhodospirillaceae bacterium]|nr:hypothetical protein [Rhodospirillaceae bacterium]